MSKASQYLRHPWTHRSDFQKSEGYGRISLDDCLVTGAKALAPDSDDELFVSERASKRRRIEKLAEGYLRGEKLFIPSARPCSLALKRTVIRQKKSSTEPGFKLPDIDPSPEPTQIWKDVEDDGEILRRLLRAGKWQSESSPTGVALSGIGAPDADPVEQISKQAACKPQRRTRAAGISADPSEEAFRQAAALRNRGVRTVAADLTTAAEESTSGATPASSADCIVVTQSERLLRSRRDKSDWLSRRKSWFSFGGPDVGDGAGTAPSPCITQSSPPAFSSAHQTEASPASRHEPGTQRAQGTIEQSQQKASYRTAQEDPGPFEEPVEASPPVSLRQQKRPRKPSNDAARLSEHEAFQARPDVATSNKVANGQVEQGIVVPSMAATRQQAVRPQIGPTYLQVPSSQSSTTPLMYRKRTTRSLAVDKQEKAAPIPAYARGSRRRVTFPSSEDVPASGSRVDDLQHVASHPPVLDLSFQQDDFFAPKLNMALVDEHKNTLLPVDSSFDGRARSIEKALRRELRDSGAEITRCDSEPPPSSRLEDVYQPMPQDSSTSAIMGGTGLQKASNMDTFGRRQTWLGTQAMAARAERELFISPEKQCNTFTPISEQTPGSGHGHAMQHTPSLQERAPLKPLSQLVPSTQAMLETWGGFSTVKKPRAASTFKQVDDPTQVATEKCKRQSTRAVCENDRSSLGAHSRSARRTQARGGSLRFSISSFNSPGIGVNPREDHASRSGTVASHRASTTTSVATPVPSSSARSSHRSALKKSSTKTAEKRRPPRSPGHGDGSFTQSMSMSADLPALSFQAAQAPAAPPGFLRDPSNLSQTIDDLTRDVFGTTKDMSGILSQ